jgi:hypothetical protein
MFGKEDTTYNDIRRKSLMQWLDDMEKHEDVAVRCGIKLNREYILHLENELENMKNQAKLRDDYLKKLKQEIVELKAQN